MTRVKSLLVFVLHQFIGTWGIAFLAAFGLFELFDLLATISPWKPTVRFVHWILTENPFYPVQIVAGLYFGWLIGRRLQHRCMLWIWIFPLAILAYAFAATPLVSPYASMLLRPDSVRVGLSATGTLHRPITYYHAVLCVCGLFSRRIAGAKRLRKGARKLRH